MRSAAEAGNLPRAVLVKYSLDIFVFVDRRARIIVATST